MKRNRNTIRVGLGERIFDVVNNLILLLIALSMLYPFVYAGDLSE